MEFLILGPLEVRDAGHALNLAGPRQRTLLALLLLRAGEVVSRDRLIEELWGSQPADTATAMVQVYVSRLRKVLPADTLVTQVPGYALRADPDQIDARRFERLLDEGLRLHAAADPWAAAAVLRDALALWRGPALADFAYENFAQAEIARLEELRLTALEARIEADLEAGRHLEVVGELEALVTGHPLRERLRGHLMLALYRCGRQAEALAAYRDARGVLVEELGIEPSPALQRLEREILAQDAALEPAPAPAAPAPSPPAPTPAPPAPASPHDVEGTRKLITVLFVEVVESEAAAPGEGPERLRRVMDRFLEAASEVFARHGGTLDTFLGRTMSAVFGVPALHEDDALRAVRAALELRAAVAELSGELQARWGVRIAVRTGIGTAEGITGGRHPRQGLVTSDAIELARRLQSAAASSEILVDDRTAAAVRGAFELSESLTPGDAAVPARRVLRALSGPRPRRPAVGSLFVGREPELTLLEGTYRRVVSDGEPHLVTVVAEPGIGKTTLLHELFRRLAEQQPVPRLRTGRCPAYGRSIGYWPLGEILREELGLRDADPPELLRERLRGREILRLSLGHDLGEELHPVEARERLHVAWVAFLEERLAERPCVLLVEDLNWAEDPLLELLEHVVRSVRGPLLLIATARPELLDRRRAWGAGRRNTITLWLEPLASAETERLLDRLAGATLAPRLRSAVLERCEGNPFFLEELVATLADRGLMSREQTLPPDFSIPDSVQAVLGARMDMLAPASRAVLQTAGVIGRVFWDGALRHLLDVDEVDLTVLEERGFIRRRPASALEGEREYAFKHALIGDIARASLPTARRARLHAGFAAWLEQAVASHDEHAPLLAHHYAEAVRPQDVDLAWDGDGNEAHHLRAKAITWLRRAAELATARCAVEEALALLRRALELEREPERQSDLWRRVAQAAALGYDGASYYPAMEHAIALASEPETLADLHSELALETMIRPAMWAAEPDRARLQDVTERALRLTRGQRTAARVRALTAKSCADPARGRGEAREASRLADAVAEPRLRSQARGAEFKAAFVAGRLDEALTAAHRRLELEPAVSDPEERGFMHWDLALAALGLGRLAEAVAEARRHDEMIGHLSVHHAVHGSGLLVMVHELAGDWDAVRALEADVEREVAANRDTRCVFNTRTLLAFALARAHAGDDGAAKRLEADAGGFELFGYGLTGLTPRLRLALLRDELEKVEPLLAAAGEPMYFSWLDVQAARLDGLSALGDRRGVEAVAGDLLETPGYLEPFALRALGLVREDEAMLVRAAERFDALGLGWHAEQTSALVTGAPGSSARR